MCPQPLRATAHSPAGAHTREDAGDETTPETMPDSAAAQGGKRKREVVRLGYTSAAPRLCLAYLGYLSPHLDGVRGTGSRPPEWHLETPHEPGSVALALTRCSLSTRHKMGAHALRVITPH